MDIQSMKNVKMVDRDSQESMVMEHSVEVDEMMDIWVNEMVEVMAEGSKETKELVTRVCMRMR